MDYFGYLTDGKPRNTECPFLRVRLTDKWVNKQ